MRACTIHCIGGPLGGDTWFDVPEGFRIAKSGPNGTIVDETSYRRVERQGGESFFVHESLTDDEARLCIAEMTAADIGHKIRLIGGPSDRRLSVYEGELINVAVCPTLVDRMIDGAPRLSPFLYHVYRIVTHFRGAKGYRAYVHSSIGDDEARARIEHMVGDAPW